METVVAYGEDVRALHGGLLVRKGASPFPTAFPLDSLGFGVYTFPPGRQWESMSFLDPLEGTEITCDMVAWQCAHCL